MRRVMDQKRIEYFKTKASQLIGKSKRTPRIMVSAGESNVTLSGVKVEG